MKKQNDPKKTKHYKVYKEVKPSFSRLQEAVESVPEHCWWLRQYLRGVYFTRGRK